MYRASIIVFISTTWYTNIYHNSISLRNAHFYIRHLYVILREFCIFASL